MGGENVEGKPKVSVIMPVYNRERYLSQAIESVLNQTYQDFELIVVDDGSTDRSPEIIRKYAERDKRVRCAFHEKNRGVSAARNTALDMAKGEWIAVIDSDDAWHPERLEKLLRIAEEGFFVADDPLLCFDRNGELVPWKRELPMYGFPKEGNLVEVEFATFLQKGAPGIKPIFPASAVSRHRLRFTEGCQFAEDLEFWCHLFRVGLKLRLLLEPLYFLRLTPNSLTAKANMLKNFDHIFGVYDRLLAHPDFSEKEKELLRSLRQRLQKDREYSLFTLNLEKKRFGEALKVMLRNPGVVLRLVQGLPRSLSYRISAKIRGGVVKS